MSVELRDISKRFGDHLVVNQISLEIPDGELFVLLGSSGCGKSTILRIIAGLLRPDQGAVHIRGQAVTHLPPQKREVGYVFQNYAIFKHMSVAENVMFGLRIRGQSKRQAMARCHELLELVGLTGFGSRRPHQLSGGQRQRVALARALAYQPSILLLDEPFGALDLKTRSQLRSSFKEIQTTLKITTILVTHDQEEAFELGERIGLLDRGKLVEVGTAQELYRQPHSEFAANFVGGGNILVGRFAQGRILLGEASFDWQPRKDFAQPPENSPVRLLVRPNALSHQATPFSETSQFKGIGLGRLREKLFTGATERLRFEVENLQDIRPTINSVRYGLRGAQIELLQTSAEHASGRVELDAQRWIGARAVHVLHPTSLRMLLTISQHADASSILTFAANCLSGVSGLLAVILVNEKASRVKEVRTWLDDAKRNISGLQDVKFELRVLHGDFLDEVMLEAQELSSDIVTLGGGSFATLARSSLAARLLRELRTPVLCLAGAHTLTGNVLICTAGGAPGRNDVLQTARLVRHFQKQVTVLHVQRTAPGPENMGKIQRHLAQTEATLQALNVPCVVRSEGGEPVDQIVRVANEVNADLLVLGQSPQGGGQESVTSNVLVKAGRPVLIVPLEARALS